jgi:hypothetical protein
VVRSGGLLVEGRRRVRPGRLLLVEAGRPGAVV